MIRPAKCHFDGFIKAFIKGADKNHNPRKGTETFFERDINGWHFQIRTIIPARGRKPGGSVQEVVNVVKKDKNHNPRKGTETSFSITHFKPLKRR